MGKCVTKDWPKALLLCLFVVILSVSLFGCGGTFRSFPNEGDVSGSWNLFLTPSGASTLAAIPCTLTQTDNTISGTKSDGATITGTVSGNDVALTLNNLDGTTTTLAGTAGPDWKTMSGTYTSTGSDGSGDWSATKNLPPAPLAVSPTSAALSCSGTTGVPTSQIFTVTGGTLSNYSVAASPTGLVTLSTTTLTTNGKFSVTPGTCPASGTTAIATLTVTDTVSTVIVQVTISNP